MTNPKWEVGPVKLVNGFDASIFSFDEIRKVYLGWHSLPGGGRYVSEWWEDGRPAIGTEYNLAPPPKKTVRVQRWIVVYSNGTTCTFSEKDEAINEAKQSGFSLLEIDREVTEGEGL